MLYKLSYRPVTAPGFRLSREGKHTEQKEGHQHLTTYKVAFRACVSLLPVLFGSTGLAVPREVLGRGGLGEKELGTVLALRVRNESSGRKASSQTWQERQDAN